MANLLRQLTMARSWGRLSARTLRVRLTLLYGGLFLVTGLFLLAITYLLFEQSTETSVLVSRHGGVVAIKGGAPGTLGRNPRLKNGVPTSAELGLARQLVAQATAQHASDLHQLLVESAFALAIMAVLAVLLGWLMAGRVLRPLRAMAATTQQITASNLHERLALPGPSDEVKNLADTIDDLLSRLEAAFDAQRRFVANASHELRTPLALDRTLIDVALADPHANADDLRATLQELLMSGEQQERLMEALLTLASSERGLDRHVVVDLGAVTEKVAAMLRGEAESREVELHCALAPAPLSGNSDLIGRLVANLLDNAIRHNLWHGVVEVVTAVEDEHSILTVINSGPVIPAERAEELLQPFRRVTGDRSTHPGGHGLGLSIVRAIVNSHHARMKLQLRGSGGLRIDVRFPPPAQFDARAKDTRLSHDRQPTVVRSD